MHVDADNKPKKNYKNNPLKLKSVQSIATGTQQTPADTSSTPEKPQMAPEEPEEQDRPAPKAKKNRLQLGGVAFIIYFSIFCQMYVHVYVFS